MAGNTPPLAFRAMEGGGDWQRVVVTGQHDPSARVSSEGGGGGRQRASSSSSAGVVGVAVIRGHLQLQAGVARRGGHGCGDVW